MSARSHRRRNLFNEDPHCHWCHKLTKLNGKHNGDLATIDHLYSKFHPYRNTPEYLNAHNDSLTVLACYDCNQLRSIKEHLEHPKHFFWARSNGYPKPILKVRKKVRRIEQTVKNELIKSVLINIYKIREKYLFIKYDAYGTVKYSGKYGSITA